MLKQGILSLAESLDEPDTSLAVVADHNPGAGNYVGYIDGRVLHPLEPQRPVLPITEYVHDAFRSAVLNPHFACVGAKSAIQRDAYRFGLYDELASTRGTRALAHDLYHFIEDQPALELASEFTTFVACFEGPTALTERQFERWLWNQLQCLHDLDSPHHLWDATVSDNPDDPQFSFSFGGRAFFVVGLHGASSRWSRRFAWPALVFNAHHQFERLRQEGRFVRMQRAIRERDTALQGDINPMVSTFGEFSEARQYSGRNVEPDWRCPFHINK